MTEENRHRLMGDKALLICFYSQELYSNQLFAEHVCGGDGVCISCKKLTKYRPHPSIQVWRTVGAISTCSLFYTPTPPHNHTKHRLLHTLTTPNVKWFGRSLIARNARAGERQKEFFFLVKTFYSLRLINMSWQKYVDDSLIKTKKIAKGSIHTHDGAMKAGSKGFKPTPAEVKTALFGINKDASKFHTSGITIAGVKYTFLRSEPGKSAYAKKGDNGLIVVKTKKAVIIGVYTKGTQPGAATVVVEKLADYLKGAGF
ncbi:uncharacterized protein LOC144354642 [Saccoglossus kowalevskii]